MKLHELTLSELSPRCLTLLAQIFSNANVRVVLSERAQNPLTVVLESWTLVLNPQQTGLYDLALGARLLKYRNQRKLGPAHPKKRDRWLTKQAHREWVNVCRHELSREFPGIARLRGRYCASNLPRGLRVTSQQVEWRSLTKTSQTTRFLSNTSARPQSLEFAFIPELDITGSENDFAWLLNELQSGQCPLQYVPSLEELPFVRIPFRLCLSERDPMIEEFEEHLRNAETKEIIRGLKQCHQRKSEVRQERLPNGRHSLSGVHLDPNRLVEAVISQRVGIEPRLFRQKSSLIEPVFDPREHLVVLIWDVNDLHGLDWDGSRSAILRFLACIVTTYQELEVDCVVQAAADRLVTLPDGRTVCLHFTTELKSIDAPFDESFWSRLGCLIRHPPQFLGHPTHFHALSLQDITHWFDKITETHEHSYRTLVWWARRGMSSDFPQFSTEPFLMRMADFIDHGIQELERRLPGTLDTLPSFLPERLRSCGRPGQYLQGVQF
ncbi:hypothetical protein LBMAG52_05100 [Planctomycetia bacterium]|nr:hypothetical protein LBMAG52_05100 [Planctomycetia bacterium]